jgi:hypothetical protein
VENTTAVNNAQNSRGIAERTEEEINTPDYTLLAFFQHFLTTLQGKDDKGLLYYY